MNLRAISLVALPVIALLTLHGCGPSGEGMSHSDAAPVIVRRGNGEDPETLDPARAEGVHSFSVLTDLYEGLLALDADGSVVAGVAESWEVSDDGLRYTFHLRDDAKWSNGSAVTAGDFVNGMRRTLQPDTASAYSFLLYPVRNAEAVARGRLPVTELGVSARDKTTFIIDLHAPAPYLLSILTMPIAFPLFDDGGDPAGRFADPDRFIGNGPFLLTDWQPGSRIRLRRNPAFREADTVAIDEVHYLPISEPMTELNMYRAGELDITFAVPGSHIPALKQTHAAELRIAPFLALYYLAFDLSEAPFDNPALRRALSMAIDRDALVRITGRGEQPAFGLVPGSVNGYEPARFSWMSLAPEARLEQARALYAQAGYSAAAPLQVTLLYDAADIHETIALAVSEMWRKDLGVDVRLEKREWKHLLAARENPAEWQAMPFAWSGDYDHPATFTDLFHSASPQNLPGYANDRYDALLDEAQATIDRADQMRLYAAAEAVALEDVPIAPLYFFVSKHLVSPAVAGFETNALDRHPSRYFKKQ